ncbi:MAG: PQQ-dependent sugar dehydrogenase [Acidimicrobiales bacterium]
MARTPLRTGGFLVLLAALLSAVLTVSNPAPAAAIDGVISPSLRIRTVANGLSLPWDLGFTPDGTMLFTERPGRLNVRLVDGTVRRLDANLGDLFVRGESGLLGLTVHPDFSANRTFYTCQAHAGPEIQVIGWVVNAGYTRATRIADPLVGGIPLSTGRHGGCRVRFGPEGNLWIATGDAAGSTHPQSLSSLGGKVLRVDPTTGAGATGNPFANSVNANTRRIYSYGHRNLQGLSQRPGTDEMWTVEHGPSRDDEVNRIVGGGNYGWAPGAGYNEGVPMTDLGRFPNAIEAQWSTGSPTLAMSGGFWVEGRNWGPLAGTLAVASLKNQTLRFFEFDDDGDFLASEIGNELSTRFGRLRTPMMGPDGSLYVTTSNGSNDRILKVTPVGAPRGAFDRALVHDGRVRVSGWAIDPNRVKRSAVRVLIDGEVVARVKAGRPRPDVARVHPDYGKRHGYVIWVDASPGQHEVCVEALDAGRHRVAPVELGCRSVSV